MTIPVVVTDEPALSVKLMIANRVRLIVRIADQEIGWTADLGEIAEIDQEVERFVGTRQTLVIKLLFGRPGVVIRPGIPIECYTIAVLVILNTVGGVAVMRLI